MSELGRKLVITGAGRVGLETFEVPVPGSGEALIKVARSQVSAGTELTRTITTGSLIRRNNDSKLKRTLGYILVGTVLDVGVNMEECASGDRVLAFGNHSSHWIAGGAPDPNIPATVRAIERIDHDITDEQAAFATLGDVAMHGVRRAELNVGESVAIFGQGVVGQLATSLCRISGAYPVIAVDMDSTRLSMAKTSGASHTIDASKEDAVQAILDITNGGAECTIHATRTAQTFLDCMKATSDRGKVVVLALPTDTIELNILDDLQEKELHIIGSNAGRGIEGNYHPYWPWTRSRNREEIWRMIASGEIKVDHLISHVVKPEEADNLYQKIHAGPTGWMSVFIDWE